MRTPYNVTPVATARTITKDRALAALEAAQECEPLQVSELTDGFLKSLRRHPLFRDIPIADFDLATADALRELEHMLDEYRWRLAQQYKREIDFHDEQPECEREEWIDWPADDNGMTIVETARMVLLRNQYRTCWFVSAVA